MLCYSVVLYIVLCCTLGYVTFYCVMLYCILQYYYIILHTGLAYVGSICDQTLSSSVVEVQGLITHVATTAAHELGHRLVDYFGP